MASGFLGLASGFSQGLAQGVQNSYTLALQRQEMQLRQQQADAASLAAFSNSMRIPDPAVRQLAMTRLFKPATGIDPNSDLGKQTLTAINKSSDDTRAALAAAMPGLSPSAINYIMSDPAQTANMLFELSQRKAALSVMSAPGPASDLIGMPSPTDTGAPVAGTAGAGGTVAAPVSDAGTSSGGSSPAIVPPAPQNVAQANAQAAAPKTQISLPKLGTARDGSPLTWSAAGDPVVQDFNKRILVMSQYPGGEKFAANMKDLRDLYISGKYKSIENYIAEQRLQVERGQLSVSRFRANMDANHIQWEEGKPMSPEGQAIWDANHHLLTLNNGQSPNGLALDVGPTAGDPDAGGVGGAAVAGGAGPVTVRTANVPAGGFKAGDLGAANTDGTIDIASQTIRKKLDLNKGQSAVWDPKNNRIIVREQTTSSIQDTSQQGDVQSSLDAAQWGRNILSQLQYNQSKNPTNFGIAGEVKGILQELAARGEDIGHIMPVVKQMMGSLPIPKDYFNEQLPANKQAENILKMIVAKELYAGTKAMGGFTEALKTADEMVDFQGLGISSKQAKVNMDKIGELLDNSIKTYKGQLPTGATANVEAWTPPAEQPQQKQQKETQLQSDYDAWQKMTPEERKPLIGTDKDMTSSTFEATKDGDSHLSKIPVGQIKRLQDSLKAFPRAEDQKALKGYFDLHFGKGASARVGYP